jgi:hypothetical protein
MYSVYAGIRRIADRIFIQCMQGSGGLPTEYSVGVCRGQADYPLNIQLVYAGVRWITDQIFIWWMRGSGEFPTEYSFSVYRVQADDQLNIQLVCAGIRRISDRIFIQCMNGVRQIANWIFSWCVQGSSGLLIRYSLGVCTSRLPIRYSLIALGGSELNI